ncbi:F-box protein skip14 [Phtheirospermum japonicum]|uniref:F-box protein skip14 n=1 Tax=Phtheirospermum japonicum TaxID=374723 RepID=A0A830BJQ4_9LAMI|nr:F-box protein skip14 [Phtheirospermum japonicum]
MYFGCEKYGNLDANGCNNADDGGDPADALFFALGYLGVKDLLSFERVCKSLRDAVRDETPVWKSIHIDCTLSDKITDDGLLRLTNRAKGALFSLSLVKCVKITNAGLRHVLESNPGLTKLSVQGCNKLNVEVILHDLKAFNSVATPGIKHLRIGHLSGLTNQHFKEFKLLLEADEDKKPINYKPRFFRAGELDLPLDDGRTIDIEMCPRCEQARQVYDCPSESCQEKIHSAEACRGCVLCISRCISCGCCLDNKAYEETFCLDSLCLDCLGQLLNCKDSGGVTLSPEHTYFHQKASYHLFLCGQAT